MDGTINWQVPVDGDILLLHHGKFPVAICNIRRKYTYSLRIPHNHIAFSGGRYSVDHQLSRPRTLAFHIVRYTV